MSNYLAVATVTSALGQILQVAGAEAVSHASVTTQRPTTGPGNAVPDPTINLYLYQVMPNAAWRNVALPTRGSDGTIVNRPQVALDLNYLISFYGDESQLEPQRMMGSVVSSLNSRPILTGADIERITDSGSPQFVSYLEESDLANQVECVRFTPLLLNLEELSRLWSVFFQTPYTISVVYQASVVLIEAEATPRRALPIRTPLMYGTTLRQLVIEKVVSADGDLEPIVIGSDLLIQGRNLRGDDTRVFISGTEIEADSVRDSQISLTVASPPAPATPLRAGVLGVHVTHWKLMGVPPTSHPSIESNVFPIVLRPTITAAVTVDNVTVEDGDLRSADLTLQIAPEVAQVQRVTLFLNETTEVDPAAYTFNAPARDDDASSITIPVSGVRAATYLVRVQVNGAESPLTVSADPDDPEYTGPTVTIP